MEIKAFTSGNAPLMAKAFLTQATMIGASDLETAIAAATVLGSLVVSGAADRHVTLDLVKLTIDAMVAGQVAAVDEAGDVVAPQGEVQR